MTHPCDLYMPFLTLLSHLIHYQRIYISFMIQYKVN